MFTDLDGLLLEIFEVVVKNDALGVILQDIDVHGIRRKGRSGQTDGQASNQKTLGCRTMHLLSPVLFGGDSMLCIRSPECIPPAHSYDA